MFVTRYLYAAVLTLLIPIVCEHVHLVRSCIYHFVQLRRCCSFSDEAYHRRELKREIFVLCRKAWVDLVHLLRNLIKYHVQNIKHTCKKSHYVTCLWSKTKQRVCRTHLSKMNKQTFCKKVNKNTQISYVLVTLWSVKTMLSAILTLMMISILFLLIIFVA